VHSHPIPIPIVAAAAAEPEPDAEAVLTDLYRVHALRLIRLAYVMLGDRQAAEDVVQDAFAGLYRRWGRLSDQMHALGVHWAPIFVQCARPAVTVMERLQLAAQQRFLGERQSQFARLVATAQADFAAAERQAHG
jgi:hypothetical protein